LIGAVLISLTGPQRCTAQEPALKATLPGPRGIIYHLAFSPDGKTLASYGGVSIPKKRVYSLELKLWEVAARKVRATITDLSDGLFSLAFAPDGRTLATGGLKDGNAVHWDVATGRRIRDLAGHPPGPVSVAFSPDGKSFVTAGSDNLVKLWDTRTWKVWAALGPMKSTPLAVAFSPDGKKLAAGLPDVWIWDYPSLKQRSVLESVSYFDARSTPFAQRIGFVADGKSLITTSIFGEAMYFHSTTTEKSQPSWLGGEGRSLAGLALSADGKTAIAQEWQDRVTVWNLATRIEVAALFPKPRNTYLTFALTPDGKTLAVADRDWFFIGSDSERTIELWDVAGLRQHEERAKEWVKNPPGYSPKEAMSIKKRIAALAHIDSPDFGMSPTVSGRAFAPVSSSERIGVMLLTNHQLKRSSDFLELVKLGPRAIPFLLQALDDKTPTKLVIPPSGFNHFGFPKDNGPYAVTVGDVCYVVLGQIVGENYSAVSYVPSGNIVLTSPTQDTELARQLRGTWVSADPARRLYEVLLQDFNTRRDSDPEIPANPWIEASDLQVQAAMRLLYYFPRRSASLIAGRLSQLDVLDYGNVNAAWEKQMQTNGVASTDLIKAVAWSREPTIRAALLGIFKRTTDQETLLATLPALDATHERAIRERLEALLDKLPVTEPGLGHAGQDLLVALGRYGGKEAKRAFIRYLKKDSLQRRWTMCRVLRETRGEWGIELLGPLLTDRRIGVFGGFWVVPELCFENLRLCDEAAITLNQSNPRLQFRPRGKYRYLDRQIEAIRQQLAKRRS
jgi:WD40 repeat protein